MKDHVCGVPSPQVRVKVLGDDEVIWLTHEDPQFQFVDEKTSAVWSVRLEYIGVPDRNIEGVKHAEG